MKIVIIIVCVLAAIALYIRLFAKFNDWVGRKADKRLRYKIEHVGLRVFNIPFMPEKTEVFYLENGYDEKANQFVKENKETIRRLCASKGFTFVYLPDIEVPKEISKLTISYYSPGGTYTGCESCDLTQSQVSKEVKGLQSNFLLDYMINPHNRKNIRSSFAWYNHSYPLLGYKKLCYLFDIVAFDSDRALANPEEALEAIFSEVGKKANLSGRMYQSSKKVEKDDTDNADDNFNNEEALDAETRKMLDEVSDRLDKIRKRGISEAVIARYIRPVPQLSHITITRDLRIILDDYNGMEIKMEPIVKTVYLFFLRHPKGVLFKQLPYYTNEMEVIYRAVKEKKNFIDNALSSGLQFKISPGIATLCDPTKNSINEKCSRIKEAFVIHFQETLAAHYYISGGRGGVKTILLPHDLIRWEDKNEM